ncbi:hypothetical protein P4S75_03600 [Anoxybacillus ayderensis]|uniref:hypothetical protein n=1 Tax=Anoxybacillus ayderensis TaxID=265546 RepID=UPI002E2052F4|nr:hypothetical protein [Anoxybacillus ayderensis]
MLIIKEIKNYFLIYVCLSLVLIFGFNIPKISIISLFFTVLFIPFFRNKIISKSFLIDIGLVFLFMISYYYISDLQGLLDLDIRSLIMIINSIIAYMLGYFISLNFKKTHIVILFGILGLVLFSIFSVYNFMIHYKHLLVDNFIISNRSVPSFWKENGEFINGPALGLYLSLGISLLTVVFIKGNLFYKFICLMISGISFYFNVALQNRTPLYIGILLVIICAILHLSKSLTQRWIIVYSLFFAFLLILIYCFLDKVITFVWGQTYLDRYFNEGLETPRYTLWLKGIKGLFDYPMGGAKTDFSPYAYAHNFWLDVGWYAGIIPFIIIILLQIRHLKSIINSIIKNNTGSYIILGVSLSYFVGCMVEPALIASQNYIIISFFVFSYIKYLNLNSREEGNCG